MKSKKDVEKEPLLKFEFITKDEVLIRITDNSYTESKNHVMEISLCYDNLNISTEEIYRLVTEFKILVEKCRFNINRILSCVFLSYTYLNDIIRFPRIIKMDKGKIFVRSEMSIGELESVIAYMKHMMLYNFFLCEVFENTLIGKFNNNLRQEMRKKNKKYSEKDYEKYDILMEYQNLINDLHKDISNGGKIDITKKLANKLINNKQLKFASADILRFLDNDEMKDLIKDVKTLQKTLKRKDEEENV